MGDEDVVEVHLSLRQMRVSYQPSELDQIVSFEPPDF